MLQNAPTLAIVAVDTEENEPLKMWGDLFSFFRTHSEKARAVLARERGGPRAGARRARIRALRVQLL